MMALRSGPDPVHQNRMNCGPDLGQFWSIFGLLFADMWPCYGPSDLAQEKSAQVPLFLAGFLGRTNWQETPRQNQNSLEGLHILSCLGTLWDP